MPCSFPGPWHARSVLTAALRVAAAVDSGLDGAPVPESPVAALMAVAARPDPPPPKKPKAPKAPKPAAEPEAPMAPAALKRHLEQILSQPAGRTVDDGKLRQRPSRKM